MTGKKEGRGVSCLQQGRWYERNKGVRVQSEMDGCSWGR